MDLGVLYSCGPLTGVSVGEQADLHADAAADHDECGPEWAGLSLTMPSPALSPGCSQSIVGSSGRIGVSWSANFGHDCAPSRGWFRVRRFGVAGQVLGGQVHCGQRRMLIVGCLLRW